MKTNEKKGIAIAKKRGEADEVIKDSACLDVTRIHAGALRRMEPRPCKLDGVEALFSSAIPRSEHGYRRFVRVSGNSGAMAETLRLSRALSGC